MYFYIYKYIYIYIFYIRTKPTKKRFWMRGGIFITIYTFYKEFPVIEEQEEVAADS